MQPAQQREPRGRRQGQEVFLDQGSNADRVKQRRFDGDRVEGYDDGMDDLGTSHRHSVAVGTWVRRTNTQTCYRRMRI